MYWDHFGVILHIILVNPQHSDIVISFLLYFKRENWGSENLIQLGVGKIDIWTPAICLTVWCSSLLEKRAQPQGHLPGSVERARDSWSSCSLRKYEILFSSCFPTKVSVYKYHWTPFFFQLSLHARDLSLSSYRELPPPFLQLFRIPLDGCPVIYWIGALLMRIWFVPYFSLLQSTASNNLVHSFFSTYISLSV